MKRQDLLTKEEFLPKRINQRFVTSANRIKYHNKKANALRHSAAYISKPIHINHRILIDLLANKTEATFHKQFLLGKGFNFGLHTHLENYEGKNQCAIYNYIFVTLEKNQIKIIKND